MAVTLCNWLWRVLIGGVFLLAAYGKWKEGINYLPAETIYDRIVGFSLWRHNTILAIETIIGLWVISSWRPRWSVMAAGTMLLAFCALLGAELWRETPMNCGCGMRQVFPDGDPRVGLIIGLVRNGVLLLGCVWLYLLSEEPPIRASEATKDKDSTSQPR